jgi:holdfast attachment protein HfaA
MTPKSGFALVLTAAATLASLAFASNAGAQTMNASSASYNAGYGRTAGQENQPVNVQMTDANGNLVVQNGQIKSAATGSLFASASAGVETNFSGAGGTASAIGNNLNVVVQGNYNTVVVTSTQTNTGAVTATTTINGKP